MTFNKNIELLEYTDGRNYRLERSSILKENNDLYANGKCDPSELFEEMNLNYIIADEAVVIENKYKIGFFCYLFFDDLFSQSLKYINRLPDYCDIYIATDSKEKIQMIKMICEDIGIMKRVNVVLHNNKGRDVSALLVLFKDIVPQYDLACFIHDKKSSQMKYATVGEDFNNHIWQSLLASTNHINNIISLFEKEKYLGIIVPSAVMHGEYYHTTIDSWTICYDQTIELAKQLHLNVKIDGTKNPLALGTAFWFRTEALSKLFDFDFNYEDFPGEPFPIDGSISHCIERLFPYVAIDSGFYTGVVYSKDIAENVIFNQSFALNQVLRRIDKMQMVNASTLKTTLESLEGSYFKKKPIDPIFIDSRYKDESENFINEFKKKYSLVNDYISIRNQLVASSSHEHNLFIKAFKRKLRRRIITELCLYRYKTVDVLLDAIENYLKGPEFIKAINLEYEFDNNIVFFKDINIKWFHQCEQIDDCDLVHAIVRIFSLNGYFFKSNRQIIIIPVGGRRVQGYRAKEIINYDPNTRCGYVAHKDFIRCISLFKRYLSVQIRLSLNYKKMKKYYHDTNPSLTTEEMWINALDRVDKQVV